MNFVYKSVVTGGAESLLLRVGRKLVNSGEKCNLICNAISDEMFIAFNSAGINVIKIEKWNSKAIYRTVRGDKTLFYGLVEFLLLMYLCKRDNIVEDFFLYLVHINTIKFSSRKLSFFNNYFSGQMSSYIQQLNDSGHIYFMDCMCIEECEKYYGFKLKESKENILHIPIDIDSAVLPQNYSGTENVLNVLTVSRAEYPFKGYVKGLIEDLGRSDHNVILKIISYGDGIQELFGWIEEAKIFKNLSIELIGETPYTKLPSYYDECDIYVGMGTTILEAALRGKVCIPVKPYSYNFEAGTFFFENPEWLVARLNENHNGISLIEKYIAATQDEKAVYAQLSYDAVKRLYSMDVFIKKIKEMNMGNSNMKLSTIMKLLLWSRMKKSNKRRRG